MPTNISVNIDTVDFSVQGMRFHLPDAITARVTNTDGEILDQYQNRKAVIGQHGVHPVHVRTARDGKELQIQGSPYAFLFGQNVYTASDLSHACLATLERVCKEFDIQPDPKLKSRWQQGDIELHRVDLAVNFRLDSEQEVKAVIRQIGRQLLEQGRTVKVVGDSAYWTPKSGKVFVMAFYAKGPQMRRSKRIKKLDDHETLVADAATMLRAELRLRASALRELGLEKLSAWQPDTALNVFKQYMKKLKFLNVTSGRLEKEELDALPSRLRPVLALHKAGENLDDIFEPRTLQRHRRDFREFGIDLRCPNQADAVTVSLPRMLSPKKVIPKPPRWLHQRGYCPPVDNPVIGTGKISQPVKTRTKHPKEARRVR
jgi:II/X family phage/plasmid replication protein